MRFIVDEFIARRGASVISRVAGELGITSDSAQQLITACAGRMCDRISVGRINLDERWPLDDESLVRDMELEDLSTTLNQPEFTVRSAFRVAAPEMHRWLRSQTDLPD